MELLAGQKLFRLVPYTIVAAKSSSRVASRIKQFFPTPGSPHTLMWTAFWSRREFRISVMVRSANSFFWYWRCISYLDHVE